MAMPEAAMNENGLSARAKHNVRLARQFWRVQSISVAHRKQHSPDYQFRLGIFSANSRHIIRTGRRHGAKINNNLAALDHSLSPSYLSRCCFIDLNRAFNLSVAVYRSLFGKRKCGLPLSAIERRKPRYDIFHKCGRYLKKRLFEQILDFLFSHRHQIFKIHETSHKEGCTWEEMITVPLVLL